MNTSFSEKYIPQLLFGCNSETRKCPVWAERQPQAYNGRSQGLRLWSSLIWVNKCCLILLWDRCTRLFSTIPFLRLLWSKRNCMRRFDLCYVKNAMILRMTAIASCRPHIELFAIVWMRWYLTSSDTLNNIGMWYLEDICQAKFMETVWISIVFGLVMLKSTVYQQLCGLDIVWNSVCVSIIILPTNRVRSDRRVNRTVHLKARKIPTYHVTIQTHQQTNIHTLFSLFC